MVAGSLAIVSISVMSIDTGNAPTRTRRPSAATRSSPSTCTPSRRWAKATKFSAATVPLEADEVGTEQAVEHLVAPREAHEQLLRGKRDVQEEADPQIGAQLAQHRRDELQLVVVHPDDGVGLGDLGGALGEVLVDLDVLAPVVALVGRGRRASWYSGQIASLETPS